MAEPAFETRDSPRSTIVEGADWSATLRGAHNALRPGGHVVFETRDPARRQCQEWNRAQSCSATVLPGVGAVETWYEMIDARGPLVTFRGTQVFAFDGAVLTSQSTLRFRERDEVQAQLEEHGVVAAVREATDRPGRELVFFAQRSSR